MQPGQLSKVRVYLDDMNNINDILGIAPVIPVVVIESADDAVEIARALLDGGLGIVEITLRTASGLAAIENIRRSVPDMCVGAGTVWTGDDVDHAVAAGAQFLVSPGTTPRLINSAMDSGLPYLPGVQTATEAASIRDQGFTAAKFFPAGAAGGVNALKSLCSVLPDMLFCPTGGINLDTAPAYLELEQVPCVGGTWLTPAAQIARRDWLGIRDSAQLAAGLGR